MALQQLPRSVPQPAGEPAAVPAGISPFIQYCGACHQATDLAQQLTGPDAAAAMVRLLGGHGAAPLADDLRIVAELAAMNRTPAP